MVCTDHVNLPCPAHNPYISCTGHTTTQCVSHNAYSHCGAHTGVCNAHSGRVAPATPAAFTDGSLYEEVKVKAQHLNELKVAIQGELTRRSKSATLPVNKSIGGVIDNAEYIQLRNALNVMSAWSFPASVTTDLEDTDSILADTIHDLRDRLHLMQSICVCDCNYSCTCNCNYACTCDCAYSDERLKMNVEYL